MDLVLQHALMVLLYTLVHAHHVLITQVGQPVIIHMSKVYMLRHANSFKNKESVSQLVKTDSFMTFIVLL